MVAKWEPDVELDTLISSLAFRKVTEGRQFLDAKLKNVLSTQLDGGTPTSDWELGKQIDGGSPTDY